MKATIRIDLEPLRSQPLNNHDLDPLHTYLLDDHELGLPPPYPHLAMDASSSSRVGIRAVRLHSQIFFIVIALCTCFNIAMILITINDVSASNQETLHDWQMFTLTVNLLQNVYNIACFLALRDQDELLTENDNQKTFSPVWFYSAPMFVIIMITFCLSTPITMMLATFVYVAINVTFVVCYLLKNINQEFNAGLGWNIALGVIGILLLVAIPIEHRYMISQSPSPLASAPTPASASSAFLGIYYALLDA